MQYISINSVLFDLSLDLEDYDEMEYQLRNWAESGFKRMNLESAFITKVSPIVIQDHTGKLPNDLLHLLLVAQWQGSSDSDLLESIKKIINFDSVKYNNALRYMSNPDSLPLRILNDTLPKHGWKVMKKNSTPFLDAVRISKTFINPDTDCHVYDMTGQNCLLTSLKEGLTLVAYKAYPSDEEGNLAIPNDPVVREAVLHYILYKYYAYKVHNCVDALRQSYVNDRDYNLERHSVLSMRARNIDLPDLGTLENLSERAQSLRISTNDFDDYFASLGQQIS